MTTMTFVNPPQQTFDAGGDFNELFDALLQYRALQSSSPEPPGGLLRSLKQLLQREIDRKKTLLSTLAEHPDYSRHIIGREGDWMGLICRWRRGAVTSIHGHPAFTFYSVIEGSFNMDLFHKTGTRSLRLSETRMLNPGDSIWDCGASNCYDNLIHRVHARTDGFTLQLFSEDPAAGEVFDDNAVESPPEMTAALPRLQIR